MGSGFAMLLAPKTVCRMYGLPDNPVVGRVIGARDVAIGAGLLWGGSPSPWMKARAASDVVDVGLMTARAIHGKDWRVATWLKVAAGATMATSVVRQAF